MHIRARLARCALFALIFLLTALTAGCNTMPSQVRDQIAKRLPDMLGQADDYSVSVSGDILELLRGKLRHVHVHGENVTLSPVLHVQSFDADAYDIHANTHTDALESIGKITLAVAINQTNLDNFIRAAKPDEFRRGARIVLGRSNITYSDTVSILGLATPFSVTGVLSPRPGHASQMNFQPSSGSFMDLSVPKRLVEYAVARQNPVVDLSQMKYPVSIQSATVQNGQMLIAGSVDLSSLFGSNPATVAPPPTPAPQS